MVASSRPSVDPNPTPEFNERCTTILNEYQQGNMPFEKASEETRKLKREAVDARHLANEARADFILGVLSGYRTHLNLAIQHFEHAREIFEKIGNHERVITADLNLGEVYRQKGDFIRARNLFDAAYEGAKSMDNLRTMTIALANKGQALISIGQLETARAAFNESLQLYQQWVDENTTIPELLSEIHHGLAQINLRQKRYDEAWAEAKETFRLARANARPMITGFANRTMAETLTAIGDTPVEDREEFPLDIDSYFQEALQAFREIDAEGEIARTTFTQAKSLSDRGRRVQAARRLQQAMIAFSSLGMVDDAAKAAELQTEIF